MPGGVSTAINLDSPSALNMERLYYIKTLIDEVGDFVKNVYLVDVCAVGAMYADWTKYGAGVTNYLSVPDMPMDTKGTVFSLPGGYIANGDLKTFKPITSYHDDFFREGVKESIKHSWYNGDWTKHPWDETTDPKYTGFKDDGKYSWVKAPTFYDKPAQVGPLANVLCMYRRRPRAHQEIRHPGPGHRQQAGGRQGGARGPPLHHRPPRRPGHPLRRALR